MKKEQEPLPIELTEAEINYIWLLTSVDEMKIQAMSKGPVQDHIYKVWHSLRGKLLGVGDGRKTSKGI